MAERKCSLEKMVNMFKEIYKGKRVLVTGHTGFKGSWLTVWLLNLGAEVAGYSIDIPTVPSHFQELGLNDKIKHYIGDIRDFGNLERICKEFSPEIIFHMAAQPLVRNSFNDPKYTFEVNVIGTLNILEVIRLQRKTVKVGVIITSDKCYNNVEWVYGYRENDSLGGEDPYSGSKGAAELVAYSYMHSFFKESYPNIATVRAGNVIGGGDWAKDRIVPDIVRSWTNQKKVEIRSPYSTRPWQHVMEPLSGYLHLGSLLYKNNSAFKNESFNFGPDSHVNKNVAELIEAMQSLWPGSPGWLNVSTDETRKESNLLKLSCDKANIMLKWYPVLTFNETIDFTVRWYLNFYDKNKSVFDFTNEQIRSYASKAKERGILWAQS